MQVLNSQEVDSVSGAVSNETAYAVAVGAAVALLAISVAPVSAVVAGAAYGGSLFSSMMAMSYGW